MKRERRFEWWGKTMLLGAGSALAVGLGGGMLSPALAQTGSAVSASLPTACPDQEALVSDEVDGPGSPGRGEVIRFTTSRITPTGARSVLSSNAVGTGPALGNTERVRVLNGVIYLLDGTSVLSVDALNGNRTLISGGTRGYGPAFVLPESATTDVTSKSIMVLDQEYAGTGALIRVDLTTGNRTEEFSNRLQPGKWNFDNPYDVVRNACNNSFYVLHSGGNGVPGNVLRVNAASGPSYGARTLFATYIAPSTPSNYSLLMRSYIVVPGGGGGGGGL
jgi:hypothetical protein